MIRSNRSANCGSRPAPAAGTARSRSRRAAEGAPDAGSVAGAALDDRDPDRITAALRIAVERGAQLAREPGDDPLEPVGELRIAARLAGEAVHPDRQARRG